MRRTRLLLLSLSLAFALPVAAAGAVSAAARPAGSPLLASGSIAGQVTNTAGQPVPGICVLTSAGPSAATGKAGRYQIEGLRRGSYQVGFEGGCNSKGSYAPQVYRNSANLVDTTPVQVSPGRVTAGIDAVMQPGGTVSGHVTDLAGSGVPGVCVSLIPVESGPVTTSLAGLLLFPVDPAGGATNVSGSYQVGDLPPGQYDAEFSSCSRGNYASAWSGTLHGAPVPLWVAAGGVTSSVNAVLQPGGTITGRISRAGRPLAGCVAAVPKGGSPAFRAFGPAVVLVAHGSYRIAHLPAGSYGVSFESGCDGSFFGNVWYSHGYSLATATPVQVTAGHTTAGISEAVTAGGKILGRVTDSAGRPVADACVYAAIGRNPSASSAISDGVTNAAGRYRVADLGSGSYTVVVAPGCHRAGAGLADQVRRGVRVTAPRASTGLNVVVQVAGTISGVVDGGPGGGPQPGICVTAYPRTAAGPPRSALTGVRGSYTIGRLAPGGYAVRFFACVQGDPATAPQWYHGRPGAATVQVSSGVVSKHIDATVSADGSITGTVTGAGSADLAGICVTAVPAGWLARIAGIASPVLVSTGSGGGYRLAGLPPGRYAVRFSSGCGLVGYQTQWWRDAASAGAATLVTVPTGGAVTGIDAQLQAG